jgi:DNA-binding XRE family transcriptional regulator
MNFEEYKKKAFESNPALLAEYNALRPEYELIEQIVGARIEQRLTQKEFAEKVGIRQSNISRLESGNYNPSLAFLKKIAQGLNKELHIELR